MTSNRTIALFAVAEVAVLATVVATAPTILDAAIGVSAFVLAEVFGAFTFKVALERGLVR